MNESTPLPDYEVIADSSNREDWLERRQDGIGASDAAGVLNASKYASAVSIFADKVLKERDTKQNELMYWGHRLESIIVEEYGIRTGRPTELDGMLRRSRSHPFMLATNDANTVVDGYPAVLEVKNKMFQIGEQLELQDWIQMQHQFFVSGNLRASYAALCSGNTFFWCDVERDDDFIDTILVPECAAFWKKVENGGPQPSVDRSDASRKAIARLYPKDNGEVVTLPLEFVELDIERNTLAKQIKAATERKNEIDNRVRQEIGAGSVGALTNGRKWTYRVNKNGSRVLRAPPQE